MTRSQDYADFWVEEGILHFVYKPNTIIDLKAAKKIVKNRLRFQDGVSYPILCDIRHLSLANKQARDYLALKGCFKASAVAFVIEEAYSGTLIKAFINISNPSVPTSEFTTIPEALEFLSEYI